MEHWGVAARHRDHRQGAGRGLPHLRHHRSPGDHGFRAPERRRHHLRGQPHRLSRPAWPCFDIIESEDLLARARRDRRADPGPLPGAAEAVPGDRRRARPGRHGGDGAGGGSRDQEAGRRFRQGPALKLYENGVVNIGAGTYHNVLRILVPLTIEDATLARGLDILDETMAEVSATGPRSWPLGRQRRWKQGTRRSTADWTGGSSSSI